MILPLLLGCTPLLPGCTPLLPGELVLGDEITARIIDGEEGSLLGAAVAVGLLGEEPVLAAFAPGAGEVLLFDLEGQPLRTIDVGEARQLSLGFDGGLLALLLPGTGLIVHDQQGERERVLDSLSTSFAHCPDGELRLLAAPGGAIACGPQGQDLRAQDCDGSRCEVRLDGQIVGEGSPGSAVGFHGELACWGRAALEQELAGGEVQCADGRALRGEAEEHLGIALAGDRAAGRVSKALRPTRARLPQLDGGLSWTVDVAVEASGLSLATGEGQIAVGVPGYPGRSSGEGRVYLVDERDAEAAERAAR